MSARAIAMHSRYDQIAWTDRDGTPQEDRVSAETVRAALLACGTVRRFTIYSARTAIPHSVNWQIGIRMLRNLRGGWYSHG